MPPPYVRITYARFEEPMGAYGDDVGWGCAVRSFQMMLANAAWERPLESVVKWFRNHPEALFSLHCLAGKPGKWCAPSDVARKVEAAARVSASFPSVVALGNGRRAFDVETDDHVLLVPMRLGRDRIENQYARRFVELFDFPGCIGCVCGVRRRSYFGFWNKNKLWGLDPHREARGGQEVVDQPDLEISIASLDPCVCMGFRNVPRELLQVLDIHLALVPLSLHFSYNVEMEEKTGEEDEDWTILE